MDYADLREGIYDHLVTEIAQVSGRVFWEWTAPADTVKPLIEFAFIGELAGINKCMMHMQVEVLVIGDPSDIMSLDPIADDVVSALHHETITTPLGREFEMTYARDTRIDTWIEPMNACCIRLKFLLPTDFWK